MQPTTIDVREVGLAELIDELITYRKWAEDIEPGSNYYNELRKRIDTIKAEINRREEIIVSAGAKTYEDKED